MSDSTSVREWFAGKSVFITGGTGFMGKVLIEKLLRSCPDIDKIYVMCRYKGNLTPSIRLSYILKLPLFDRIRAENPSALEKVVSVYGELTRDGMGLHGEDFEDLTKNVSVVFNLAASLKLDAGLKDAILANTVGTYRTLNLAKSMTKLEAFIHVSTTFCHPEKERVTEDVIDIKEDPFYIMDLVSWMDAEVLEKLRPHLIGRHPNCYTYTKALTEKLIEKHATALPVVITRPSIVVPTFIDPVPGWVDTLNGPIGVLVAGGKGVLRSMLCSAETQAQVIPVDLAINGMIIIAWKKATNREVDQVPVYNLSCSDKISLTWGDVLEKGQRYGLQYPINPGLWYPNGTITTNPYLHALYVFLFQTIPAYAIDLLLLCLGQKPFMVYVQNKISHGLKLLQYFTMRKWNVDVEKAAALVNDLDEEEKKVFYTSNVEFDIDGFIISAILGARQYCLKEPLSTLPQARIRLKIYYFVDVVAKMCLSLILLWSSYSAIRLFSF